MQSQRKILLKPEAETGVHREVQWTWERLDRGWKGEKVLEPKRCRKEQFRDSLAVQWLGLGAFTAGARVQSLVGKLRSCKPHGVPPAPKTNKQTNK